MLNDQFIGPVSTNRDASCSIAKSLLIALQFLFFFFSFSFFLILSYWPHHGSVSLSYYTSFLLSPLPLFLVLILCAISSCHPHPHPPFLTVAPQPPVILGLERNEVKAERTLVLECVSYGGNPLATLHWTKVNLLRHLLRKLCNTLSRWQNEPFLLKNSQHKYPILCSFCSSLPAPYGSLQLLKHSVAFLSFMCSSVCQNGEVLSMTWEEDVVAQKSSSILKLKITPADNQAELCCESSNLVSRSPLSVSRKITVLCE